MNKEVRNEIKCILQDSLSFYKEETKRNHLVELIERCIYISSEKNINKYCQLTVQIQTNIQKDPELWIKSDINQVAYLVVNASRLALEEEFRKCTTTNNNIERETESSSSSSKNKTSLSEVEQVNEIQNQTLKSLFENYEADLAIHANVKGDIICINKKCNSDNISVVELQTKSADEPADEFCRCRDCNTTWVIKSSK